MAVAGGLKRWNGTAWVPVKRWSGSKWDPVKVWNGTSWRPSAAPVGPAYVGESHLVQATSQTSMTMTLPAGLQTGDLVVIAAVCTDTAAGSAITPATTGWTVGTPIADQGTMQRALYYATYTPGLVAPSWTLSVARRSAYVAVAVRNPITAPPGIDFTNAGGLTMTSPTITGTKAGSVVLRLHVRKDNLSTTVTPPAGLTQITVTLGTAGPAPHVAAWYGVQGSLGPSGTAVSTWNVTSTNSTAWTVTT